MMEGSGKELEGGGVVREHDAEVAAVERRDRRDLEAFREDDQARVGAAEPEVGIGLDQVGDPLSVAGVTGSSWISPAARARKNAASALAPSCRRMR